MSDENPSQALEESCTGADETMGSWEAGSATSGCPSTWIAIQVVGEDDRPLPDQAYRIVLPDGRVVEGSVDVEGVATVENIPEGDCSITLPGLDGEAWEYLGEVEVSEEGSEEALILGKSKR